MMSKDPAFLFYPNDYLGGTMGFTLEQHGAYLLLLIYQFNNGAFTQETAQQIVGKETFDKIRHKFDAMHDGCICNARLMQEIERRKMFSESRRQNAQKRWNNSKNDDKTDASDMRVHNICNDSALHMGNENETINEDVEVKGDSKGGEALKLNLQRFEIFWKSYPKKEGKGYCRKIWLKMKPSQSLLDKMLDAIDEQRASAKWNEQGGKYIPMPSTWLNQGRWEDEMGAKNERQLTSSQRAILNINPDEFKRLPKGNADID